MTNVKQLCFGDYIFLETLGNKISVKNYFDEKPNTDISTKKFDPSLLYQVLPSSCPELKEHYRDRTPFLGLKKSVEELEEALRKIQMKFKNKVVKYGDEIRLLNIYCKGFLAINNFSDERFEEMKVPEEHQNVEKKNKHQISNHDLLISEQNEIKMEKDQPNISRGTSNKVGTIAPITKLGAGKAEKKEEKLCHDWSLEDNSLFILINVDKKLEITKDGEPIPIKTTESSNSLRIRLGKRKLFLGLNGTITNLKLSELKDSYIKPVDLKDSTEFQIKRVWNHMDFINLRVERKGYAQGLAPMRIKTRIGEHIYFLCCEKDLNFFLIREHELDQRFFQNSVFYFVKKELDEKKRINMDHGIRVTKLNLMDPNIENKNRNYLNLRCAKNSFIPIVKFDDEKNAKILIETFEKSSSKQNKEARNNNSKLRVILLDDTTTAMYDSSSLFSSNSDLLLENSFFKICFTFENEPNKYHVMVQDTSNSGLGAISNNYELKNSMIGNSSLCFIEDFRSKENEAMIKRKEIQEQRNKNSAIRENLKRSKEVIILGEEKKEESEVEKEMFTSEGKTAEVKRRENENDDLGSIQVDVFHRLMPSDYPPIVSEKVHLDIFPVAIENIEFPEMLTYRQCFKDEENTEESKFRRPDQPQGSSNESGNSFGQSFLERITKEKLSISLIEYKEGEGLQFQPVPLSLEETNLLRSLQYIESFIQENKFLKKLPNFLNRLVMGHHELKVPLVRIQTLMRELFGDSFSKWLSFTGPKKEAKSPIEKESLVNILNFLREILKNDHYGNRLWISTLFDKIFQSKNLKIKEMREFLEGKILIANKEVFLEWKPRQIKEKFSELNRYLDKITNNNSSNQLTLEEYSKASMLVKTLKIIFKESGIGSTAQNLISISMSDQELKLIEGSFVKILSNNSGSGLVINVNEFDWFNKENTALFLQLLNMHEQLLKNNRVFFTYYKTMLHENLPYMTAKYILLNLPIKEDHSENAQRNLLVLKCQILDMLHTLWFSKVVRVPAHFILKKKNEKKENIEGYPTSPSFFDIVKDMKSLIVFKVGENGIIDESKRIPEIRAFLRNLKVIKRVLQRNMYLLGDEDKSYFYNLCNEAADIVVEALELLQAKQDGQVDPTGQIENESSNKRLIKELEKFSLRFIPQWMDLINLEVAKSIYIYGLESEQLRHGQHSQAMNELLKANKTFYSHERWKKLNLEEKFFKNSTKLTDLLNIKKMIYEQETIEKKIRILQPVFPKDNYDLLDTFRDIKGYLFKVYERKVKLLSYFSNNNVVEGQQIVNYFKEIEYLIEKTLKVLPIKDHCLEKIISLNFSINEEVYQIGFQNSTRSLLEFQPDVNLEFLQQFVNGPTFLANLYNSFMEFADVTGVYGFRIKEIMALKLEESEKKQIISLLYKIRIYFVMLISAFIKKNNKNAVILKKIMENDDNLEKYKNKILARDHHLNFLVFHLFCDVIRNLEHYTPSMRAKRDLFKYVNWLTIVFFGTQDPVVKNPSNVYHFQSYCSLQFDAQLSKSYCRSCFYLCLHIFRNCACLFKYREKSPDSSNKDEDLSYIRGFIRCFHFQFIMLFQANYNYDYFANISEVPPRYLKFMEFDSKPSESFINFEAFPEKKTPAIKFEELLNNCFNFYNISAILIEEIRAQPKVLKDFLRDFFKGEGEDQILLFNPAVCLLGCPFNYELKNSIFKFLNLAILQYEKPIQETVGNYYTRHFNYLLKGSATDVICVFNSIWEPIEEIYKVIENESLSSNKSSDWLHSPEYMETFLNFPQIRAFSPYLKDRNNTKDEQKREMFETLVDLITYAYKEGSKPEIIGMFNYHKLTFLLVEVQARVALSTNALKLWQEPGFLVEKIEKNLVLMQANFLFNKKSDKLNVEYFNSLIDTVQSLISKKFADAKNIKKNLSHSRSEVREKNSPLMANNIQENGVRRDFDREELIKEVNKENSKVFTSILTSSVNTENVENIKHYSIATWLTLKDGKPLDVNTLIKNLDTLVNYLDTSTDLKDKDMNKSVVFTLELIRDFTKLHMMSKLSVTNNISSRNKLDHINEIEIYLKEDSLFNVIFKSNLIKRINSLLFSKFISSEAFFTCIEIYKILLQWYPMKLVQDKIFNPLIDEDDDFIFLKNLNRFIKEIVREVFEDERKAQKYIKQNFISRERATKFEEHNKENVFKKLNLTNFKRNQKLCNYLIDVLEFLKACCENNHKGFKDYFLEQQNKPNKSPINIVEELIVGECLEEYAYSCNSLNFDLGISILNSIIEIIEGQDFARTYHLVTGTPLLTQLGIIYETVSHMDLVFIVDNSKAKLKSKLNKTPEITQFEQTKFSLITKITEVIISLIENSDERTHKEIVEKLNFDNLIINTSQNLFETFDNLKWLEESRLACLKPQKDSENIPEKNLKQNKSMDRGKPPQPREANKKNANKNSGLNEKLDSNYIDRTKLKSALFLLEKRIKHRITEEIFKRHFMGLVNLFILIKMLFGQDPRNRERFKLRLENTFRSKQRDWFENEKAKFLIYRIAEDFVCRVELVDINKKVKLKLFPKYIICHFLMDSDKTEILQSLNRTSYESKIADFYSNYESLKLKMSNRYLEKKFIKNKVKVIFIKLIKLLLLALTIFLIVYLFVLDDCDINAIVNHKNDHFATIVFRSVAAVQFILAVLAMISHFFDPSTWHKFQKAWGNYTKKNQKNYVPITKQQELEWLKNPEKITRQNFKQIIRTRGYKSPFLYLNKDQKNAKKDYALNLEINLIHTRFLCTDKLFLVNLFTMIFCALTLFHPVFVPFQLVFQVLRNSIIQDVLRSFSINYLSFVITILLGLIIIFIYSVIGFYFLTPTFIVDNNNIPETQFCPDSWGCFVNIINYGLRMGGGIGDIVNKVWSLYDDNYTARWFYDLIFFFLITVVMLNLIFGIIINTFSTIRDKKFADRDDQTGKCFICNYEKGTLDKIGSGFDFHVKNEHNMWVYLFYLINIEKQEGQGISQLESYIWRNFRRKNFSFTPYFSALGLSKQEDAVESDTKLENISNQNKAMLLKVQEIVKNNQSEKILNELTIKSKDIIIKMGQINNQIPGCSINSTLLVETNQKLYQCRDNECKNLKLCEFCLVNCHMNHDISLEVKSEFGYCNCFTHKSKKGKQHRCCLKTCTSYFLKQQQYLTITQARFECKTCRRNDLCQFCAKSCHLDHDIMQCNDTVFQCKCDENKQTTRCLALWND